MFLSREIDIKLDINIGGSSGDVIQTIQTKRNNIINYIY